MKNLRMLPYALLVAVLAGCTVDRIPGVYRIDVEQGNVLDAESVAQLQPGMTRQQVRFLLGTPMLVDTFHPDRWDYIYRVRHGNGRLDSEHITVHFDGDTVTRVAGRVERTAEGGAGGQQTVSVSGPAPDERGMLEKVWDALTDWGDD